jgi:hypothetical protein
MKKTVIILGVLAVTGGIAYFMLQKRKGKTIIPPFSTGGVSTASSIVGQQGLPTQTSGSSQLVSGIDVPISANAQIAINEQANLEQANAIVAKLRKAYEAKEMLDKYKRMGVVSTSNYNTKSVLILSQISGFKNELNKLGHVFEGTTKGTIRKV